MKFPIVRSASLALLCCMAMMWQAPLAQAGVLRILEVEDKSKAKFTITYASGATETFSVTDGDTVGGIGSRPDADDQSGGNGNIKVILGDASKEATIKSIDAEWIHFDRFRGNSNRTRTINKLTPGTGTVITSLEPFDEPGFTADLPLLVVFDAAAYVTSGIVFADDALFDVTDGLIGGIGFLRFKDLSGVDPGADLSSADIDALPDYSGSARAITALRFDPLASPSPLWLLAASLLPFGWRRMAAASSV